VSLGKLTNTWRLGASKGTVRIKLTVKLPAGYTLSAGSITVAEDGNESNAWRNREPLIIESAQVVDGVLQTQNVYLWFTSNIASSNAVGPAGSLTKLITSIDGVLSVTNENDAQPGRDIESIEDLRLRQSVEIGKNSSSTLRSIRSAVEGVTGVQYVSVEENQLDTWKQTLPPHSFRLTVWDGLGQDADNQEIFDAIGYDIPPGTSAIGDIQGTYTTPEDDQISVSFSRGVGLPVYIIIQYRGDVVHTDVERTIATEAKRSQGQALRFDDIITAAKTLGISVEMPVFGYTAIPTTSTALIPASNQILLLDSSRITAVKIS